MTPQTPFDLAHQGFGEAQVMEGLLQDRGGVLRLEAIMRKALLHCETAALSGFGLLFRLAFRGRHGALLASMGGLGGYRLTQHL